MAKKEDDIRQERLAVQEKSGNLLEQLEGYKTKLYVPTDKQGKAFGNSGITVLGGLDLGQQTENSLKKMDLPEKFINLLKPFLGHKKDKAIKVLEEANRKKGKPLDLADSIDRDVLDELDDRVKDYYYKKTIEDFNSVKGRKWDELSPAEKTVLFSTKYQMGDLEKAPRLTKAIKGGDTGAAIKELKEGDWGKKFLENRKKKEGEFLEKSIKEKDVGRQIDSISTSEQPDNQTELDMSDISKLSEEELLQSLREEAGSEISMSNEELLTGLADDAGVPSPFETFGIRAANAVAFDFGDEMLAGAEAAFTDKPYDQALKENRDYLKQLERANPNAALAGDIVGGVAGSVAGAGVFNSAFKIGKLANLGGNARNIVIGAQEGAIAALGKTEEDKLINQLEDSLIGGGIGLAGGAIGSAVSSGMSGLKSELMESGEELIDRSMGVYNTATKRKLVKILSRKDIGKEEFYDQIQNIKLSDGTQVFNAQDTLENLNSKLKLKTEEFHDAYQAVYNTKSEEIGAVLDPEDALSAIKTKFVLDNEQVTKDLMNPRMRSTYEKPEDIAAIMGGMFPMKDKMTLGQLHSSIKSLERELLKKQGAKSYFQLDDTAQSALTSAREYLEESMQAHLKPEDMKAWKSLQQQFNITKEYGKLVQNNSDYTNKGAIASLVKAISSSSLLSVSAGAAVVGSSAKKAAEAAMIGTVMRRLAQSPKNSSALGSSLKFVGNVLATGQATDGTMKRLVNAATRSVEDFEVEVEHESIRLQGGLPTEEERQAEEAFIKNSDLPVRNKLQFIEQARQGVKPNYEQNVQPPVYNPPQFAPRDESGKKVDREDEDFNKIMGKTQVREIMP